MVKPNFLVDKPNNTHEPSIFTKKNAKDQCWKVLRITCSFSWIVVFKELEVSLLNNISNFIDVIYMFKEKMTIDLQVLMLQASR